MRQPRRIRDNFYIDPMSHPAIVVAAWNRPHSLARLLKSLRDAHYPEVKVPLVIALDGEGDPEVVRLAEGFSWEYGPKEVIIQPQRRGLKSHILACGDLSERFGRVVLLEDDLLVSPWFYQFATLALAEYRAVEPIAGISLYCHAVMESNAFYPFWPVCGDQGVYFLQYAVSWGQAWTAEQWQEFRGWYAAHPEAGNGTAGFLEHWGENSWKKHFVRYLMATGRYFVCPGTAYATNFGDAGVHFPEANAVFQVPLAQAWRAPAWRTYVAGEEAYDASFEPELAWLRTLVPELGEREIEVDLHGQKDLGQSAKPWVLTSRPVRAALRSWGRRMKPIWQNLRYAVEGNDLHLARREDVLPWSEKDRLEMYIRWHRFYYPVPRLRSQVLYEFLKGIGATKK